jgi:hypothetical protein
VKGKGPITRLLLDKGPQTGVGKIPNYAVISATVSVVASAGVGYAAYAAAKSQNTDETASILSAVGASLGSILLAYGGVRWSSSIRRKELSKQGMRVLSVKEVSSQQQAFLDNPRQSTQVRSESFVSVDSLSTHGLAEAELAYRENRYVSPEALTQLKVKNRISYREFGNAE